MSLYPGKIVIYRFRQGQVRAGQTEAGAMVLRVNNDSSLNLMVYPDGPIDVAMYLRSVPEMSDKVQTNCWLLNPDERKNEKPPLLQLNQKRAAG